MVELGTWVFILCFSFLAIWRQENNAGRCGRAKKHLMFSKYMVLILTSKFNKNSNAFLKH